MTRYLAPLAVLTLASLAGCSSSTPAPTDDAPPAAESPASTPAAEPAPEAAPALDCLDVDPAYPVQVLAGAQDDTGALTPVGAAAFRSPDHAEAYLVAIRFEAAGVDPQVGVWATNRLDGSGVTMSVDGIAQAFTVWPDASSTDADIDAASPGVDEALECLGDA